MVKKNGYSYISLKLPSDFYYTLVDIAADEVERASKKWKVKLSEEEREDILEHSSAQLVKKVEDITYHPYSLYDEEVKIRVLDERKDVPKEFKEKVSSKEPIFVVNKESISDDVFLGVNTVFNATHGYSFVDIATRRTVLTDEFYAHFMESMEKWLRTAVFYGVASYAD